MTNTVYLSGPANKIVDPSLPISADWKLYAASTFLKSGITVANPIELDLTGFVKSVNEHSGAIKHSLTLIDRADSLLVNLLQVSESATMEMFYAHSQGKQVVVLGSEPFNPWVLFHSSARFQKLKEALDYLVNQPVGFDTLTWSNKYETQLKRQAEQYPPEGEQDFEYYGGNLPVLILAPHATSYFLDGNLFQQESYTGTLATLLHKLTGCHALLTTYCMAADPVYYLNSPYARFLLHILKKTNIKMVLVLHGIEDWNIENDLVINSWNKQSLKNKTEYQNLLISLLNVKEFKDIGFDSMDLVNKGFKTINHLIFEEQNIPAMRIEIHKRLRLPKLHPTQYMNLHNVLAQFIMLIGAH